MKLPQSVFEGVDPKLQWAWLSLSGHVAYSTHRPWWSRTASAWILTTGSESRSAPFKIHKGYVSPDITQNSLLERTAEPRKPEGNLDKSLFERALPEIKYLWVGNGASIYGSDMKPIWIGHYVSQRGSLCMRLKYDFFFAVGKNDEMWKYDTLTERESPSLYVQQVGRVKRLLATADASMPGQEIFDGKPEFWQWATICENGQVYLSDKEPFFSFGKWQSTDTSWEKVYGAIYPQAVASGEWKTWSLKRENTSFASQEAKKLWLQDARHNAAVMVDTGRLSMDQFNEIFPE